MYFHITYDTYVCVTVTKFVNYNVTKQFNDLRNLTCLVRNIFHFTSSASNLLIISGFNENYEITYI